MDYFDDTNTVGSYTTTVSGEFYGHPIETSVPGWVDVETPATFHYAWGVDGWTDRVPGLQTGLRAEAGPAQHQYNPLVDHGATHLSPEPMSSMTSYGVQTQGYSHSSFLERHQSTAGWDTQPLPSDIMFWENYPVGTVGSGTSAVTPIPDTDPFNCWGPNQSESSRFYTSVQNLYQPGVDPTGLGTIHMWQTEPYLTRYTDSEEYANIEAGPSNFVPLHAPYTAQPFTNPSGGSSEATDYAEHRKTFTEENAAPTWLSPHTGQLLSSRALCEELFQQICVWARDWKRRACLPTREKALSMALDAVRAINPVIYSVPRLASIDEKDPDSDHGRGRRMHRLSGELSRYYVLPEGEVEWVCSGLLSKVLHDLKRLVRPSRPPPVDFLFWQQPGP